MKYGCEKCIFPSVSGGHADFCKVKISRVFVRALIWDFFAEIYTHIKTVRKTKTGFVEDQIPGFIKPARVFCKSIWELIPLFKTKSIDKTLDESARNDYECDTFNCEYFAIIMNGIISRWFAMANQRGIEQRWKRWHSLVFLGLNSHALHNWILITKNSQ